MTHTDLSLPIYSALQSAERFLLHAEKTILRHSNALRTLSAHPRKVVSRQARRFYAQQLFLHRLHAEQLQKLSNHKLHLAPADAGQFVTEVEILKEMQLRLATRFFRFIRRHQEQAAVANPLQVVKTA